jgi:hypothetical protein
MTSQNKVTYEINSDNTQTFVVRTDLDGKTWWIPMDESNSDYQRYLRWLENPDADDTQGGIN